eukprot:TRINITY_DN53928_c0_g1_i1.p1 TRINITY_DN53928_c0_g1~~TRINITY_DN53928_c0_g1_i1.p1  ORF type:complete len:917 (+),score=100.01 TRINITY_DN53928_c0_g1_i1:69-2819(+)
MGCGLSSPSSMEAVSSSAVIPSCTNDTNPERVTDLCDSKADAASSFVVHNNKVEGCDIGKYFEVYSSCLTRIVGQWANGGGGPGHVKQGQGAVLRARNQRTNRVGGLLIWGYDDQSSGKAYGCWNPVEFCTSEDWETGDVVELLDYVDVPKNLGSAVPVQRHELGTGTGWRLSGEHINWGACGLVGDHWKELDVHFYFGRKYTIQGVRTDSHHLPYDAFYLTDAGDWVKFGDGLKGTVATTPVVAAACRLRWDNTDMHMLEGISSARGGGGIHAEFLGYANACDENDNDNEVTCNDGLASPAAPIVKVASTGGASEVTSTTVAKPAVMHSDLGKETKEATTNPPVLSTTDTVAIKVPSTPAVSGKPDRLFSLLVLGNEAQDCEKGKYFQFNVDDLTAVIGPWVSSGGGPIHVKQGQGAVLRGRNQRSGKEDGLLLWGAKAGSSFGGYGCWNPAEYCTAEDWQVGDIIELLDYEESFEDLGVSLPVQGYELLTKTGWNLSGEHIGWGRCGLVGDFWKELDIKFDFGRPFKVRGVRTDSLNLPFDAYYLGTNGEWINLAGGLTGVAATMPVITTACRLHWRDTNMHMLGGISTYRGGGGIHAEFLGNDEVTNDSNDNCPLNSGLATTTRTSAHICCLDDAVHLARRAPATALSFGSANLSRIADRNVLEALGKCLETRSDWLGVGRDVEETSSTYSSLQLCAAWSVEHRFELGRYELAKMEIQQHLEQNPGTFPSDELKSKAWANNLGVQLDSTLNETFLLHGTTPSKLPAILSTGLNERHSSGLFGSGSYLADDAGKADQYCPIDATKQSSKLHEILYPGDVEHPGNVRYMLLCRALLGHFAVTLDGNTQPSGQEVFAAADKRELACIPGLDPPVAYHSLICMTGKRIKRYKEVVIFHADRIVVDYVIGYHRIIAEP